MLADSLVLTEEDWRMRIEIGAHVHSFDSELDLAPDYGPYVQISMNLFERLWGFVELRHVQATFEVPGPNPSDPAIDVDTWLVGLSGQRPVTPSSYVGLFVAAGRQRYDVAGAPSMERDEPIYVAGISLVAGEGEYFVRIAGEVEYLRTSFNQAGGVEDTMLNYVGLLAIGIQF